MARMGRGDAAGRGSGPEAPAGMPMGGPSEDELQAMLLQMREAPVEQVLAEVINVLFQTIQVKLGLADARVLIDVVGALADTTAGRIDPQLQGQVAQALSQLRLAQVEEERRQGTPPATDASGAGAPTSSSAPPGAAAARAGTPPDAEPGGAASRLWVPGR
jgi:hypothetical protein